jgi:hypothetical protein
MIPGKANAVTCGQTINLRLPYGLLVSIGIEGTGGAECDDQKRNNGHHTAASCGSTIKHHRCFVIQKQALNLIFSVTIAYTPDSALSIDPVSC